MLNSNQQTVLLDTILKKLSENGILEKIIFVGSWCIYFYQWHFEEGHSLSKIKTQDIDIDVSPLVKAKKQISIPDLLKPLDFEVQFAKDNFIFLVHPVLKIEFLSPEKGRGTDKPLMLPGFGISAQPLRFLSDRN